MKKTDIRFEPHTDLKELRIPWRTVIHLHLAPDFANIIHPDGDVQIAVSHAHVLIATTEISGADFRISYEHVVTGDKSGQIIGEGSFTGSIENRPSGRVLLQSAYRIGRGGYRSAIKNGDVNCERRD